MPASTQIDSRGETQLSFRFVTDPPRQGSAGFRLSRSLWEHPSRPRILRMVRVAMAYFPELRGISLRVGLARGAHGYASLEEPAIWLNPRRLSYQTIAHELVHLLQGLGQVPRGERSCDLYSLARDTMLVDAAPVYLTIPEAMVTSEGGLRSGVPRLLFETAREAIWQRGGGRRQYIRWFEERIAEGRADEEGE